MKNFYFIVSYNVYHPTVLNMLKNIKLKDLDESMVDFKIRSKLYMKFEETMVAINADFDRKVEALWPGEDKEKARKTHVLSYAVSNPVHMVQENPEFFAQIMEKFGQKPTGWDEECDVTIFFAEGDATDEENEMPSTWMFKYELYHLEDAIALNAKKNGEYIFKNVATHGMSSRYH